MVTACGGRNAAYSSSEMTEMLRALTDNRRRSRGSSAPHNFSTPLSRLTCDAASTPKSRARMFNAPTACGDSGGDTSRAEPMPTAGRVTRRSPTTCTTGTPLARLVVNVVV